MTNFNAQMKWCPMVREQGGNIGPQPFDRTPKWARCIGSDCALWRQTAGDDGDCGLISPLHIETFAITPTRRM